MAYHGKDVTIDREYHVNSLKCFNHFVKEEYMHLSKTNILFHQENACVHTCVDTMGKLYKLGFEPLLIHHICKILPLSIIFYFLIWNIIPVEKNGFNDEVVIEKIILGWWYHIFRSVRKTIEKTWTKWIELKIDYVEWQSTFLI